MNKTELLSTYTAEQLADMVVELQNGKENKVFKVKDNKNYQKEIDDFFRNSIDKTCNDILEQKNNAMAMEFTRIIGELLRKNGVSIRFNQAEIGEDIHHNIIERKYGIEFDSMDFSQHDKEFTDKIEKLQSEVEKYRKAFEGAKKERDCQIAEYQKKIEKLTAENAELYCELQAMQVFPDEFPIEPIKVTDMLIDNTMQVYSDYVEDFAKAYSGQLVVGNPCGDIRLQVLSYLRQIAEHLLVYCNHNGEAEE